MIGGKYNSLVWKKPKKPKKLDLSDRVFLASSVVRSALWDEASEVGFPMAGKVTKNARDQAVELLEAAAEVEHALLTEYLYAAYSIDPTGPAAKLQAVIVEIATEEMGHLITVQNLLLAIGATPYLDRESVTLEGEPAGDYPFPITFEPLSGDTLATYVMAESMPPEYIMDPSLQAVLKPIFDRAIKATGSTINHVGLLYAKIYWCFQADDSPTPPWSTLPGPKLPSYWHIKDSQFTGLADTRQVKAAEFEQTPVTPANPEADPIYVIEIRSRNDALFALNQIAQQGEGYQSGLDSHFTRFLNAYNDFNTVFPKGTLPVPTNPSTGPDVLPKPVEDGRITQPKALCWARLFDIRYQLLLLELWLGVSTDPTETGPLARENLLNAALSEMTDRIKNIGKVLLPSLDRKQPPVNGWKAGAPFGMPDKALPRTVNTVQARMNKLLNDAESLAVKIEQLPKPDAPSAKEAKVLKLMRDADKPFKDALAKP